ncbi:MAG: acyltransferase family protein [Clostridia bacterium]|nr:acyltransferase family protein [Clostridia bacterium]
MSPARRDPRWDNAKFLLILLVVFGHAVEQAGDLYDIDRSLFLFIYSFHMPAFLFISGLFSKRTVQAERYPWKKLVPFVFLCLVLGAFRDWSIWLRNPDHGFSFYDQNKISWFMLALFACYSIAWLLRRVPPKYVLPASLAVGLAIGYVPFISEGFALSRIIVFFPFFYAGYMLDRKTFASFLDRTPVRLAGGTLFLTWFVLCFVLLDKVYLLRRLFTGQNNYDEIPKALGGGEVLYRLLAYAISALIILAFFTLVPRRPHRYFTRLGARTLSVYFWHLPILDILLHTPLLQSAMEVSVVLQLALAVVLTFALTYLFAMQVFVTPVNWMLDPWSIPAKLKQRKKDV